MFGFDDDFVMRLVYALGHSVWQGLLIVLATTLFTHRSQSATLRYRVSVIAMFLAACCVPVNYLALNQQHDESMSLTSVSSSRSIETNAATIEPIEQRIAEALPQAMVASSPVTQITPEPPSASWEASLVGRWILAVYILGVAGMTLRLVLGFARIDALRRRSNVVSEMLLADLLRRLEANLGRRVRPMIRTCREVRSPIVVGIVRPMILLPPMLLTSLSAAEVESILLHEFAHLHRRDHLVHLAQRCIEAMLFFNPAIWWLSRNVSIEREYCCDELAIRWGSDPCDLASSLLEASRFERRVTSEPRGVLALAALGDQPTLPSRVRRILGHPTHRPAVGLSRFATAMLGVLIVTATAAFAMPRDEEPPTEPQSDANHETAETQPPAPEPVSENAEKTDPQPPAQEPQPSEIRRTDDDQNSSENQIDQATNVDSNALQMICRVVDAEDLPITDATIFVQGLAGTTERRLPKNKTYHPGEDGNFHLTLSSTEASNLYPLMWIFAPGHPVECIALSRLLAEQNELEDIAIRLPPVAPESRVRVLDPNGQPVSGAFVYSGRVDIRHGELSDGTLFADGPTNTITPLPEELIPLVANLTDKNGWASLSHFEAKDAKTIQIRHDGFGTQEVYIGSIETNTPFAASPVKENKPKEVHLAAVGSLRGKVVMYTNLKQLAGTEIRIRTDKGRVSGIATVTLNERGEWFVPNIAAGRGYTIYSNWNPSLAVHPVLSSRRWTVEPNDETFLEIQTVPTITVHGRVLLEDTGEPVVGAWAFLNNLDSPINGVRTVTDEDGRFTLRVPPGSCLRQVTSMGVDQSLYANYDYPRMGNIQLGSEQTEITLEPWYLPARKSVRVRLQDQNGNAVPNTKIGVYRKRVEFFSGSRGSTDATGHCTLKVRDWWYVKDHSLGKKATYQWALMKTEPDPKRWRWEDTPLRVVSINEESVILELPREEKPLRLK